MKKLALIATLFASVSLFAQNELVDFSKIKLDSWGDGHAVPVVTLENEVISIVLAGPRTANPFQWDNQVKITLENVAAAGLSKDKEYKLSFTAVGSVGDCGGVTLKFFDDNQLFYTDANYLNFSTSYNFESEWLKLGEEAPTATNGMIVFAFGWDPAQTVTISKLSLLERDIQTAVENVEGKVVSKKVIEDGQLIIIKDGVRYNANGTIVK